MISASILKRDKTGRLSFPGIPFDGHLIAKFKEFCHIYRIKFLLWFFSKVSRNIGQVKIIAIPFGQGKNLVKVSYPLRSYQGVNRSAGNRQQSAIYAPIIRLKKGVSDYIYFGDTLYFQLFRYLSPVQCCRIDKDLGAGTAVNVHLVIGLTTCLNLYQHRWKGNWYISCFQFTIKRLMNQCLSYSQTGS